MFSNLCLVSKFRSPLHLGWIFFYHKLDCNKITTGFQCHWADLAQQLSTVRVHHILLGIP